jgi:hypothetical protein
MIYPQPFSFIGYGCGIAPTNNNDRIALDLLEMICDYLKESNAIEQCHGLALAESSAFSSRQNNRGNFVT